MILDHCQGKGNKGRAYLMYWYRMKGIPNTTCGDIYHWDFEISSWINRVGRQGKIKKRLVW